MCIMVFVLYKCRHKSVTEFMWRSEDSFCSCVLITLWGRIFDFFDKLHYSSFWMTLLFPSVMLPYECWNNRSESHNSDVCRCRRSNSGAMDRIELYSTEPSCWPNRLFFFQIDWFSFVRTMCARHYQIVLEIYLQINCITKLYWKVSYLICWFCWKKIGKMYRCNVV